MYVPDHFRPTQDEIDDLLRHHGAVDLITVTARGLLATMLPMAWDENRPAADIAGVIDGLAAEGEHGVSGAMRAIDAKG